MSLAGPFLLDPRAFWMDERVRGMTELEVFIYFRLLCHQWEEGSIPIETETVAMVLCEGRRRTLPEELTSLPTLSPGLDHPPELPWFRLQRCFELLREDPSRMANRRLADERLSWIARRGRYAKAGKKGGKQKATNAATKEVASQAKARLKPGSSDALAMLYPGSSSTSSSSSSCSSSVPSPEVGGNGTLGGKRGDARGGERPPPTAPPEVVEGKKPKGAPRAPKARKAFPFAALPLELAALPWFRERWEYRINSLPSKDLPTPAGEIEQLQEALLLYRTHGEEALRKGVTKAINRGWTGFEMGWCLDRNGAVTNGYDRDAVRQEHKQAGNSPATQARLAAAIIERERAKREYEESFLTEGPRNDDD